jgi:hypothetical protein
MPKSSLVLSATKRWEVPMDKQQQMDYLYLEHHLTLWMQYPPEIGIEAVIQVKHDYFIKYGVDALRQAVEEITTIMISAKLGEIEDGHLRRYRESRTADARRKRRVRARKKARAHRPHGNYARQTCHGCYH